MQIFILPILGTPDGLIGDELQYALAVLKRSAIRFSGAATVSHGGKAEDAIIIVDASVGSRALRVLADAGIKTRVQLD